MFEILKYLDFTPRIGKTQGNYLQNFTKIRRYYKREIKIEIHITYNCGQNIEKDEDRIYNIEPQDHTLKAMK